MPALLFMLILIVVNATRAATAATDDAARRPNIVLVLVDDLGYGDLSCHGNPVFKTPHIDRLHGESVRLTAFCVSATCAPTRAALMTGRHEFRSGVVDTIGGRERLSLDALTLPERLRQAGYVTGLFGKWHLGATGRWRPEQRGFDRVVTAPGDTQHNALAPTLLHDGEIRQHTTYREDVLFDEAIAFIEKEKDRPFFCMIPTYAPHAPLVAHESLIADVSRTFPEAKPAAFYAMIAAVDNNIGRLLRRLGDMRLDEQTIVILISDNGGTYGVDRWNADMRGCKGAAWHGGTRAVSFWRWPGKWRPRDVSTLTAHVDVMPTLSALAGCENTQPKQQSFDGVSLRDCLAHDGNLPLRHVFQHVGRWPRGQALRHAECFCGVRDGPFLLVRATPCDDPECRGICRGTVPWRQEKGYTGDFPFHYALTPGRDWALYDIHADPACRHNLAAQQLGVVEKLKSAYSAWWQEVAPIVNAADAALPDHSTRP